MSGKTSVVLRKSVVVFGFFFGFGFFVKRKLSKVCSFKK